MIVKEEIKGCKLCDVPFGGLFKYRDMFFIKTSTHCPNGNCPLNVVDVKSGERMHIDDFAFVEYFPDAFIAVRDN